MARLTERMMKNVCILAFTVMLLVSIFGVSYAAADITMKIGPSAVAAPTAITTPTTVTTIEGPGRELISSTPMSDITPLAYEMDAMKGAVSPSSYLLVSMVMIYFGLIQNAFQMLDADISAYEATLDARLTSIENTYATKDDAATIIIPVLSLIQNVFKVLDADISAYQVALDARLTGIEDTYDTAGVAATVSAGSHIIPGSGGSWECTCKSTCTGSVLGYDIRFGSCDRVCGVGCVKSSTIITVKDDPDDPASPTTQVIRCRCVVLMSGTCSGSLTVSSQGECTTFCSGKSSYCVPA